MFGPMDYFKATVRVLDKGGAAFDPIAAVAVPVAVDVAYFGVMYVAADNAVSAFFTYFRDYGVFEPAYVFDRVFDLVLQIGG